jgi:nicotinate-nucleotide--dimethylbenzimidazole phosphoribosyltransferase
MMADHDRSAQGMIDRARGSISEPDSRSARLSRMRQLTLARPAGSLGRLDETIHHVAAIRGEVVTACLPAAVSVLAGDHGVARHGTSVFQSGVTRSVLMLIEAGRAPVNVMAERVPARVVVADFGLHEPAGSTRYRVGPGTADVCVEDAMPSHAAVTAIANGIAYAQEQLDDAAIVAVGEIGVGNTTVASALTARLLNLAPAEVVGAGSGVDDATVARKRAIVEQALRRTDVAGDDVVALLAALGGYEIAGNVGVILAAAAARQVVVLDGFITGVAALLAVRMCPTVRKYLIASHQSAEPGHAAILEALGLRPLLALEMRLGMSSGGTLALGLISTMVSVTVDVPPARTVGLAVAGEPSRGTTRRAGSEDV